VKCRENNCIKIDVIKIVIYSNPPLIKPQFDCHRINLGYGFVVMDKISLGLKWTQNKPDFSKIAANFEYTPVLNTWGTPPRKEGHPHTRAGPQ